MMVYLSVDGIGGWIMLFFGFLSVSLLIIVLHDFFLEVRICFEACYKFVKCFFLNVGSCRSVYEFQTY